MSLDIGFRQIHDVKVVNIRGRITFGDDVFEVRESLRTEAAVRSFGEMAAANWNTGPQLGERGQSDGI